MAGAIRVTAWNEFRHEKADPRSGLKNRGGLGESSSWLGDLRAWQAN